TGAGISDQAAHILAILSKAVHRVVLHKVSAHFEAVFPDDPSEGISKSSQVLVLRPICISIAIREGCVHVTETHCRVAKRSKLPRACYCPIGIDIGLMESNPRKESPECCVAVYIQFLRIETAASLVDDICVEDAIVGSGDRVIPAIGLLQ